jgi:CRP-like cAMP-binding protein
MTPEQVIEEMRKHLAERKGPEDHLVLTSTWRHLLDPDMPCDMFKRRVRAQPGGKELWADYTRTVKKRRQQFEAALRAAASEKRSVYAVAELWGIQVATDRLRGWGIKPWGRAIDFERLRAKAEVGMTIKQLAQALGVTQRTVGDWMRDGKLETVVKFGQQALKCHWRWVVTEVVRAD